MVLGSKGAAYAGPLLMRYGFMPRSVLCCVLTAADFSPYRVNPVPGIQNKLLKSSGAVSFSVFRMMDSGVPAASRRAVHFTNGQLSTRNRNQVPTRVMRMFAAQAASSGGRTAMAPKTEKMAYRKK